MKTRTKYYLVVMLVMLLAVAGQTAVPQTATASIPANVIEVQSYGNTYGELSARWWQWLLSIPAATNPNTGGDCAQGQYDDVWFLAGAFGGRATRTCIIPAGKPIFFPVINTIAYKPTSDETLLDLRKLAAAFIDSIISMQVTIDGTTMNKGELASFRVRSPSFTVIAPKKGLVPPGKLQSPGNTDPLVSDGYWLLLSPLSTGMHQINFQAATSGGFTLDVTYTLSVLP
jgi:hypothetical protein